MGYAFISYSTKIKPDTKSVLAPTPVAEQKKICSKCGTSVKSYASYCPACGSKFS